ncbi:glycosyltransferase family 2 protein [Nesterenkonia halotolerans]|uniref:Glycosyltransferase involved in cell wall biosynthesis n=1 Tax=Nesterenkonia halotolerans TaxID=225325 RepID=A0ABR9J9T5_9MICC|nr:glycosyltransferase family 2 protein [Nesterenkonia halotolerans]MBE1515762.1 glycosyltransferase involved in cell wall biosynthesis [Nesterenkonia halotolerans]
MKFKIVNYQAHRISGWVYDPETDQGNAVVDLVVNGEAVSALTCNIFRDELSAEEFSTRNVGFLGTLPPQFWTGEGHDVALVHRGSGQVLTETRMDTNDSRVVGADDLSADYKVTAEGKVAGWASAEKQPAYARVTVDGTVIDEGRTDRRELPWKRGSLKFDAPFGFMHATQIPSTFFDNQMHRVQVFAGNSPQAPVPVLDYTIELAAEHSDAAALEAQRLQQDAPDTSSTWLKSPRIREEIRVERFALTECYASITLTGEIQHRRLVLRLGEAEVILTAVTEPPEGDPEAAGTQRYAGEIPLEGRFSESVPLFTPGADVASTYDVRLGDTTGRRPARLPETLVQDTTGDFLLSETVLDGGVFTGWAFHTAGLDFPVELVLREITNTGQTEVHRTSATLKNKHAKLQHGIREAGYALALPSSVLVRRSAHLQLLAVHARGERVLWEDRAFYATNHFLLAQALQASSSAHALELLGNARRAGRKNFVESFLGTYKHSRVGITLDQLETAIAEQKQSAGATLEPAHGAIWYWVHELRTNPGRLKWFTTNAIRNRNGGARDVLAYAASKGRYEFGQLHGILESYRAGLFKDAAGQMLVDEHWKSGILAMAQFLFAAPRDETDQLDALTLYSMIEEWRGVVDIKGADRAFYGDLLRWRGEFEESARVLTAEDRDAQHDYSQNLLALNAVNPHVTGISSYADAWLAGFNELLEEDGVAPISIRDDHISFYNVTTNLPPAPTGDDAPLVTVIMPIYEPSAATNVAVDSLLRQTWRNLEIIMIDDCSPERDEHGRPTAYRQQLEDLAARDPRIRLVLNEVNRGSYSVRNEALDLATGDLITVADKDDWHHPQQIELQVRDFQASPERVANMTNWVRVDEQLSFVLRSATGRVVYPSMASLMFRRDPVLTDLGYWDTVRKSGDSEFKSRIENYYGINVEPITRAPLAFALMDGANLTRDDMGVGYLAPERRAYLRGYKSWHREIRESDESPYMPKAPQERRFVAPAPYLPGTRREGPAQYDVVFASEFGFLAGNSTSLFNEISVCLNAGLRVGVIPFQNGLIPSASKRQFSRKIDDLVLTGQVDRLSLDTVAEADLLVVRWPTAVQMVPDMVAGLKPQRAVIVSNHPPFEPSGERRSYDIGVVTRNIERLFGVRPLWAPQSEQIGAMISPLMPASDMTSFSWKGIIELKEQATQNRFRAGRPTIGRHARDDAAKWPSDRKVFKQVYPADGSANVCILGGTKVPVQKGFLSKNPPSWEVYAFNEITVDEYLAEKLDFFVYFHSDGWLEAFGMAILEAMSYGVVCVLPRHFEPVFKDAAIYAGPDQVTDVINELWDSRRYAEQQQRAVRFIEEECTPEAYLRRLAGLGVQVKNNEG